MKHAPTVSPSSNERWGCGNESAPSVSSRSTSPSAKLPIYLYLVGVAMGLISAGLNGADVDRSAECSTSRLGSSEWWSFATSDGTTETRCVAADNGAELRLPRTDGRTEFELGSARGHVAVGVEAVARAFNRLTAPGSSESHGTNPKQGPVPPSSTAPTGTSSNWSTRSNKRQRRRLQHGRGFRPPAGRGASRSHREWTDTGGECLFPFPEAASRSSF